MYFKLSGIVFNNFCIIKIKTSNIYRTKEYTTGGKLSLSTTVIHPSKFPKAILNKNSFKVFTKFTIYFRGEKIAEHAYSFQWLICSGRWTAWSQFWLQLNKPSKRLTHLSKDTRELTLCKNFLLFSKTPHCFVFKQQQTHWELIFFISPCVAFMSRQ